MGMGRKQKASKRTGTPSNATEQISPQVCSSSTASKNKGDGNTVMSHNEVERYMMPKISVTEFTKLCLVSDYRYSRKWMNEKCKL